MLDQLKALDMEAQTLKTECIWRNAEIDNIRTPINIIIQFLEIGEGTYGINPQDVMRDAQIPLQKLRDNPYSAGNHERYKPTI